MPLLHEDNDPSGPKAGQYNPLQTAPLLWEGGRLKKASYIRLDVVRKIHLSNLRWFIQENTVQELALAKDSIDWLVNLPVPESPYFNEKGARPSNTRRNARGKDTRRRW